MSILMRTKLPGQAFYESGGFAGLRRGLRENKQRLDKIDRELRELKREVIALLGERGKE